MRPRAFLGILALLLIGALAAWGMGAVPTPLPSQGLAPAPLPSLPVTVPFIEIVGSCGPHFDGECADARSGPGDSFPSLLKLRDGIVLPVATSTITDESGTAWYKVLFTEWLRYPGRVGGEWYVAAPYAEEFSAERTEEYEASLSTLLYEAGEKLGFPSAEKRIVVDRSEQTLYAYEGDDLYLETPISTGLDLTPTPRGTFTVYRKTPSRYMQGPLPGISDQYYDLPGVPWNMYFTKEGGAIHGAYWHTEFGKQWSHGCVNLPLDTARMLYEWTPLGTTVIVQD